MSLFCLYFFVGIFVGLFSGLLGGGSGLILIPVLTALLIYQNTTPELTMRLAVGTSLAIALLAMVAAMHQQRKKLPQIGEIVKQLVPGGIIGSIIGTILAGYLTGSVFKNLFGTVLIIFALLMLVEHQAGQAQSSIPNRKKLFIFSIPMGIIATCFGVGMGPTCVPLLKKYGLSMATAITVATFVGGIIVLFATIGFIIMGYHQANLPAYSLGYVVLPMVFGIGLPCIIFSRLGSRLTYLIPARTLKLFFVAFLLFISLKMFS